jgi:hypothetical protein
MEEGVTVVYITKYRKSRIIMKDGKQILEQAAIIREQLGDVKIVLETAAPVCSKTKFFLQSENDIEVRSM